MADLKRLKIDRIRDYSDDDPIAELTRIMGLQKEVLAENPELEEFGIDLERELLGELARDHGASYAAFAPPPEDHRDNLAAMNANEPAPARLDEAAPAAARDVAAASYDPAEEPRTDAALALAQDAVSERPTAAEFAAHDADEDVFADLEELLAEDDQIGSAETAIDSADTANAAAGEHMLAEPALGDDDAFAAAAAESAASVDLDFDLVAALAAEMQSDLADQAEEVEPVSVLPDIQATEAVAAESAPVAPFEDDLDFLDMDFSVEEMMEVAGSEGAPVAVAAVEAAPANDARDISPEAASPADELSAHEALAAETPTVAEPVRAEVPEAAEVAPEHAASAESMAAIHEPAEAAPGADLVDSADHVEDTQADAAAAAADDSLAAELEFVAADAPEALVEAQVQTELAQEPAEAASPAMDDPFADDLDFAELEALAGLPAEPAAADDAPIASEAARVSGELDLDELDALAAALFDDALTAEPSVAEQAVTPVVEASAPVASVPDAAGPVAVEPTSDLDDATEPSLPAATIEFAPAPVATVPDMPEMALPVAETTDAGYADAAEAEDIIADREVDKATEADEVAMEQALADDLEEIDLVEEALPEPQKPFDPFAELAAMAQISAARALERQASPRPSMSAAPVAPLVEAAPHAASSLSPATAAAIATAGMAVAEAAPTPRANTASSGYSMANFTSPRSERPAFASRATPTVAPAAPEQPAAVAPARPVAAAPVAAAPIAARPVAPEPAPPAVSLDDFVFDEDAATEPVRQMPAAAGSKWPAMTSASAAAANVDNIDLTDLELELDLLDVPDDTVALAEDIDVPDLPFHHDIPAATSFDDLDAELEASFAELNAMAPASHDPRAGWAAAAPVATASAAAGYAGDARGLNGYAPRIAEERPSDGWTDTQAFQDATEGWAADAVAEPAGFDENFDETAFAEYDEPVGERRSNRRGLIIAGAVVGVALLGGVAALALSIGGSEVSEPAVVRADPSPIKVRPENPGGVTVPNQDKAVYDRVAGTPVQPPGQERLVSDVEEPVDLSTARPATPALAPVAGDAAPQGAAKSEDRVAPDAAPAVAGVVEEAPAVTPRRVRTMIVRPDGTMVPREEEPVAEAAQSDPAPAALDTVEEAGAAVAAVAESQPAPRPATPSDTTAAQTPAVPPRQVETQAIRQGDQASGAEVAAANPAAPETAAPRGTVVTPQSVPVAPSRPSDQPVDIVGSTREVAAAAPAASSEWSMQIASQPTREGAQASYVDLARRYGNILGGKSVNIVKADIAGKGTFWRVRIPAGSKDEANALCGQYKAAGGSCFVSR